MGRASTQTSPITTQPKAQVDDKETSWISKLFALLFALPDLHVPSKNMTKYRNKMTYGVPITLLSPLAQDHINGVCEAVDDWENRNGDDFIREVMVKGSRDGSMLLRMTLSAHAEDGVTSWGPAFCQYMVKLFPSLQCICYNVARNGRARPTKDVPLIQMYGVPYVMETTPLTGLPFQIGPDAFSEINHEVELLQSVQTVEWIKDYHGAILIVSGRDINSYGLGFGSAKDSEGNNIFSEVIAVQHCPLVHQDALLNYERHAHIVKATVLHCIKDEMAQGVAKALEVALERQKNPPVVVVTTGGRKGLNPLYVKFLKEHPAICCIVYNSCSTKSLERDMEGFMGGEGGYSVTGFRAHDFFPGTQYSASITCLKRRPKTLILPVGPSGVGKSCLAAAIDRNLPRTVLWWQRDSIFSKLRETGNGLMTTKRLVHAELLVLLQRNTTLVKIVDSTNGSQEARCLYVNESNPSLVILVQLRPTAHNAIEFLMERTSDRLNGSHISFPVTTEEQRIKHTNILKGMQYPSDFDACAKTGGKRRTVLLQIDPQDEAALSSVPFAVFLEVAVSCDDLRESLKRLVGMNHSK